MAVALLRRARRRELALPEAFADAAQLCAAQARTINQFAPSQCVPAQRSSAVRALRKDKNVRMVVCDGSVACGSYRGVLVCRTTAPVILIDSYCVLQHGVVSTLAVTARCPSTARMEE